LRACGAAEAAPFQKDAPQNHAAGELSGAPECYDFSMTGNAADNPAARVPQDAGGFGRRTVLSLESRRSAEIAVLIENCGGRAMVAPATREVPASDGADVARFAGALLQRKLDLVIFLTGVGTRALARAIEPFCARDAFVAALSKVPVLARGPKPVAALKELGVPIQWNVPEPNTWREILRVLDQNKVRLAGKLVAVQEYGVPSKDLVQGLEARGAEVLAVHVYDWALPEDVEPLRNAISALLAGGVDVVLFTAAIQVHHLLQVAEEMSRKDALVVALGKITVASIGPVTSEALGEYGIRVSLEPTHPKMGFLVREAAEFRLAQPG
jgi:uroporphyrinogen-III synthase